MADSDLEDRANNGNDWDVVSLTASTYAAAPSYRVHEYNSCGMPTFGGQTPRTMFLSDHFVFPPSEHENLPLVPDVDEHVGEEEVVMETKEDSSSGEYDEEHYELDDMNVYDGQRQFSETLSEEEEAYESREVDVSENDEVSLPGLCNPKRADVSKIQPEIPSANWWKRHASSLYSNAKESNSFWSIFVAATVMGLVIIGQRWQQERWQVLQKMARLLGPLSRLKDAVIGSHHRISFLRSSASVEH